MSRWRFVFGLSCALSLAVCCYGQTPASPSTDATTAGSTTAASSATTPAKKVWTNDDLGTGSRASIAANKQSQKYTMTKPADQATVARVKQSLQKLQGQLDDVNKQLASYKEFQQGEPVSTDAHQWNKAYSRMPVDQQIGMLQDKKKKLEGQIDDLLEEARKKGIEPGQLR